MKVALFANIPAPYRVPVYDRLAKHLGADFRVIYMTDASAAVPVAARATVREQSALLHSHVFLSGHTLTRDRSKHGGRDLHLRYGVLRELRSFEPDVVITGSFNPPMLAAWLYALCTRTKHVALTDSWLDSERGLTALHRFARRAVYSSSSAFIGASEKSWALFQRYGARRNFFKAPLGVDNESFVLSSTRMADRPYDLVFAGRLVERKLPSFFVDVVESVARTRSVSVLVIGDGPLFAPMQRSLSRLQNVSATFTGYLSQRALPAMYCKGKVFCFPTHTDPWGIVANEACAAGMPVVTCPSAGCAGELVVDGLNGFVLPLDSAIWSARIVELLCDVERLEEMSTNARQIVADYSFDRAADGILAACSASSNTAA
jgi:glycosyltransferase involved in cell wall biosynthesis